MPRKVVTVLIRDELSEKVVDQLSFELPLVLPVSLTHVIQLVNNFFLLVRRNEIPTHVGKIALVEKFVTIEHDTHYQFPF